MIGFVSFDGSFNYRLNGLAITLVIDTHEKGNKESIEPDVVETVNTIATLGGETGNQLGSEEREISGGPKSFEHLTETE